MIPLSLKPALAELCEGFFMDHENKTVTVPSAKITEELYAAAIDEGYQVITGDSEHMVTQFIRKFINDQKFPLLNKLNALRKDRRESTIKVLSMVLFFACKCDGKHKDFIPVAHSYVAKKVGLTRQTVSSAIDFLIDAGFISRVHMGNCYDGSASIYRVSNEVFIMAYRSRLLCNKDLWWEAGELKDSGLTLTPVYTEDGKFLYTAFSNTEKCKGTYASMVFPNSEGDAYHELEVGHESCYSVKSHSTAESESDTSVQNTIENEDLTTNENNVLETFNTKEDSYNNTIIYTIGVKVQVLPCTYIPYHGGLIEMASSNVVVEAASHTRENGLPVVTDGIEPVVVYECSQKFYVLTTRLKTPLSSRVRFSSA